MTLKQFLKTLPLLIALSFSNGHDNQTSPEKPIRNQINLENVLGDVSFNELKLINEAIESINRKYSLPLNFSFLEAKIDENDGGEAYSLIRNKEVREKYGDRLFRLPQGREIIVLQDISFYKFRKEGLWNSIYMQNPSNEILYKRTVLHEVGHLIYDKIASQQLAKDFFDIDVKNEIVKKGSKTKHPAHPSFYTYFFSGFEDEHISQEFVEKSASETFSDIFALKILGFLDNVKDLLLAQKISLMEKELSKYEK